LYYDFQLSKAQGKFGDKVLMFKLPCYQEKLAPLPRETMSFSDKVRKKLSDMIDSCSLPWKWSNLPLTTWTLKR